jgi:hypothetical protein
MEQKKEPDAQRPPKEWEAVSRQSKALEEIDTLIKSDEPAGEKLKKIVEDHSAACDEIKEKLAATKAIPEEEDHTVGTFSGEEDHVVRTREGEPVPGDTGDQGGGQN